MELWQKVTGLEWHWQVGLVIVSAVIIWFCFCLILEHRSTTIFKLGFHSRDKEVEELKDKIRNLKRRLTNNSDVPNWALSRIKELKKRLAKYENDY